MSDTEGSDDILELIDKIMGYADNQPLILNHLAVLRQRVVELLAVHSETATSYATLEAQVGRLHAHNEHLEHDLAARDAKIKELQKPVPFGFDIVERPPGRCDGL